MTTIVEHACRNTHYTGESKQNMIAALVEAVSDRMLLRVRLLADD